MLGERTKAQAAHTHGYTRTYTYIRAHILLVFTACFYSVMRQTTRLSICVFGSV